MTGKILLLGIGHLLMAIGTVGLFLPVLPTTIFWIGAAACYAKSSPERYRQLVGRGRAGKAVQNFLDHGVISRHGKMAAVSGMMLSLLLLYLLPLGIVSTVLGTVGLMIGAGYVLSRPASVKASQIINRPASSRN